MKKSNIIIGVVLLIYIVISNLYIAVNYYFLDTIQLPEFYFWQAN
jgi:hypothetical protein